MAFLLGVPDCGGIGGVWGNPAVEFFLHNLTRAGEPFARAGNELGFAAHPEL
jgi:hypothetical protein